NANERKKVFRDGDCNKQVEKLASALRDESYAALIFLDPFGMQINWESISKLKGTHSDIWILLPTGVIVNRLLDRKGELKSSQKLESFFGLPEEEIRNRFYVKTGQGNLFNEYSEHVAKITDPIEKIASLYVERLSTIWKHVTPKPLVLKNRKGTPIFHFVFASNISDAVKIAKDIIQKN
ncbi:MAG: three-Cys-motif partner protein TcmP, partial [Thermoanaerobaculia bacterium]|nr:three-Cys-motif partner protein TcmP [Thermoanaerobaculia bacterium]